MSFIIDNNNISYKSCQGFCISPVKFFLETQHDTNDKHSQRRRKKPDFNPERKMGENGWRSLSLCMKHFLSNVLLKSIRIF